MFYSRHPTNSELLYSIVSHLMIPETVIIEVSAKRFFLFSSSCSLGTILELLQSSETQRIKYKKKTITTFSAYLTLSHPKFSQTPKAYISLF